MSTVGNRIQYRIFNRYYIIEIKYTLPVLAGNSYKFINMFIYTNIQEIISNGLNLSTQLSIFFLQAPVYLNKIIYAGQAHGIIIIIIIVIKNNYHILIMIIYQISFLDSSLELHIWMDEGWI
ncbi:hypothetical protein ACJX0J_016744, partial [Zea mays]